MKRIILHWSGGAYQPNHTDFEHYHYLVNGQGLVIEGKYKPEDNLDCTDGKYAQHTGGGNTGSIGVAFCSMYGFKSRGNAGEYPITPIQFESCMEFCSRLASKYSLEINPETVLTHYEFGKSHPKTTSAGKIDIVYLPPYPTVEQNKIGDFIRGKVQWYYKNLK